MVRYPDAAKKGLKDTLQAQQYFLACQWRPEEDVSVELPETANLYIQARVMDKTILSRQICRLTLDPFGAVVLPSRTSSSTYAVRTSQ